MKNIIISFLLLFALQSYSQKVPKSGSYTTSDGLYSINVAWENDTLKIVEPNKTSVYTALGNNIYKFVNPTNNIEYRIEVVDEKTISSFKPASPDNRTLIYFTGGLNEMASDEDFEKFKKVAEKYKAKMSSDSKDAQLWALCAAVAMARASMNEEGFEEYATKIVKSVKQIIVDPSKCPCEDAIPAPLWSSVK